MHISCNMQNFQLGNRKLHDSRKPWRVGRVWPMQFPMLLPFAYNSDSRMQQKLFFTIIAQKFKFNFVRSLILNLGIRHLVWILVEHEIILYAWIIDRVRRRGGQDILVSPLFNCLSLVCPVLINAFKFWPKSMFSCPPGRTENVFFTIFSCKMPL